MGLTIKDGKGKGFEAEVTGENQLSVRAVVIPEIEHESEENGQAYNWSSDLVNIDANDTVLLVKNTSDNRLHIDSVSVNNGSTASEFTVHLPTTEVTPTGGTLVTGTNLNTASSNVADAVARSDEENNTQGNVIATRWLSVDSGERIPTPGLILGKNKSVAVDVVETTTEVAATIIGHYED